MLGTRDSNEPLNLTLMESANREEAKRCLNKARHALYSGVVTEAERLAKKSLRLCSTKEAEGIFMHRWSDRLI